MHGKEKLARDFRFSKISRGHFVNKSTCGSSRSLGVDKIYGKISQTTLSGKESRVGLLLPKEEPWVAVEADEFGAVTQETVLPLELEPRRLPPLLLFELILRPSISVLLVENLLFALISEMTTGCDCCCCWLCCGVWELEAGRRAVFKPWNSI